MPIRIQEQRKNLEKRERFSGWIDKIKFVDVRFEG